MYFYTFSRTRIFKKYKQHYYNNITKMALISILGLWCGRSGESLNWKGETLEDIRIIDIYPKYFIEESEFFFYMYYSQPIYKLNKTKTANSSI